MTIEERFAKERPIWFNNIHPSRIGQFVEPSNTFCPLFPLLSLPVSRYKNLGHRMESWDIAYEPRTGRCNHLFSSIFLLAIRFLLFLAVQKNKKILFGPNACESIELKCLRILKLSLRWRSVKKRSKVFSLWSRSFFCFSWKMTFPIFAPWDDHFQRDIFFL